MRIVIGAIMLCFVLAAVVILQAAMQPVGGIDLRNADHMRTYLAHKPFGVRVDGGPALVFTFKADGTFIADGLADPGVVPMDAMLPWINLPRQRFGLSPEAFAFLEELFPEIDDEGTRAQRVSGTWSADETTLSLERVPIPTVTGGAELMDLAPMDTPLGWVDGKLRIEVGGIRLMKVDWPTAGSPASGGATP